VGLRATVSGLRKKPPLERIGRGSASVASGAKRGTRDVFFADKRSRAPAYARGELKAGNRVAGPALVEEHASTTVLLPGDRMKVDGFGNLVIDVGKR
jgi:N-methylhydantoinase A